jgi:hypothetical protein
MERRRRARTRAAVAVIALALIDVGGAGGAGAAECPDPGFVARDNAYSTTYGKEIVVLAPGVLANDGGTGLELDRESSDEFGFGGSVVFSRNGRMRYTPDPGFSGVDTVDYWVTDACGDFDFATVTVTVRPVVRDDTYKVWKNTKRIVRKPGVLANDLGVGEMWAWPKQKTKNGGTVVGNDRGGFTYTPKRGFTGKDRFKYHVIDTNYDNLASAYVTLNVVRKP